MTIGIATVGPNAGLGLFKALRAAERVGSGSIGGFATFAAITADRRLIRSETQRGGTTTLFLDGETTGVDPSEEIAAAPFAAVISSGPERPDLVKLVMADAEVGLVTGHRLPIQIGVDGLPLNQQVLDLMRAGRTAQEAVDEVIAKNEERDAGLIAIDRAGNLYGRNSQCVLRRKPDMVEFTQESPDGKAKIVIIYNAIRPQIVIAPLIAQIAIDAMVGYPKPDGEILLPVDLPVVEGARGGYLLRREWRRGVRDHARSAGPHGNACRLRHDLWLPGLCRRPADRHRHVRGDDPHRRRGSQADERPALGARRHQEGDRMTRRGGERP
jgi:hypothetical protein